MTEIVERVPETEILTEYLQDTKDIDESTIETVELTVGEEFSDYTIVTKTEEGVKQYEYLVNTQTKEVKQVNVQVISKDIPIVEPQEPEVSTLPVDSQEAKPILVHIIDNKQTKLERVDSVQTITKEVVTKGTKYEIEYVDNQKEVKKVVVLQNSSKTPVIIDERPIIKDFVKPQPVVIKEKVDESTKVHTVVYPSLETFNLDKSAPEITKFIKTTVAESSEYTIQAVRKETFGNVEEYDILLKADKKAPIQITVAKDKVNKNIVVL